MFFEIVNHTKEASRFKILIKFEYVYESVEEEKSLKKCSKEFASKWINSNRLKLPNVTYCRIFVGQGDCKDQNDLIRVRFGRAVRSVKDKFIKEVGRKRALANALDIKRFFSQSSNREIPETFTTLLNSYQLDPEILPTEELRARYTVFKHDVWKGYFSRTRDGKKDQFLKELTAFETESKKSKIIIGSDEQRMADIIKSKAGVKEDSEEGRKFLNAWYRRHNVQDDTSYKVGFLKAHLNMVCFSTINHTSTQQQELVALERMLIANEM